MSSNTMPVFVVMTKREDGRRRPYDWRNTQREAAELAARLRREGHEATIVKSAPREVEP